MKKTDENAISSSIDSKKSSKRLYHKTLMVSPKTIRSYNLLKSKKRQELIALVEDEQMTIRQAAIKLQINYSAAKYNIKNHRKQATET